MAVVSRASHNTHASSKSALIGIFAVSNIGLFLAVSDGRGTLFPLFLYLLSIASCIALLYGRIPERRSLSWAIALNRRDIGILGGVMGLQLAALAYFSSFPLHYVQDEFITGYASYTLPAFHEINWFAGYPPEGQFIAQFPILYFALQKPFLVLLGPSLEAIRIATWPYHLLTAALVYLLGRELFRHRLWAAASAVVYVVLAPNLYMAGYGTHNISSTFFFLAAFYFARLMLRHESRGYAVVCGVFATLGYLTYTSSYLTIPLLALFVTLVTWSRRGRQPFDLFSIVLVIVVVGLLPFVTYAFSNHNYFLQRGDQVNAIEAFWGEDGIGARSDESPSRLFWEHVKLNVESLHTPGIGGITDYWFGKQALFESLTLYLLLLGIAVAVVSGLARRRALDLMVVSVVLATFMFGMLLTLPAGGFHRTTMAFPFVALLIVLAVRFLVSPLWRFTKRGLVRMTPVIAIVITFAVINVQSAETMVRAEEEISGLLDSVPITEFVEQGAPPGSRIVISAFWNYHLRQEILVRTGEAYEVEVKPFDRALDAADDHVIVLWRPSPEQLERLREEHPHGKLIDAVNGTPLERHRIFVPGELARSSTAPARH
jgi:4-amino-4-deoxy-L-arabinose transferase-like glycosyltransferase